MWRAAAIPVRPRHLPPHAPRRARSRVRPGLAAGRPERDPAANPWLINFANYLCAGGLGTPPRGGGWANLTVSLALRWPVEATETTRPVIQGVVGSSRLF
jgi:hypothetical protein